MNRPLLVLAPIAAAVTLAACGGMRPAAAPAYSQTSLPATVQVPAGHRVALETVGVGEITYQCRAKADTAGAYEWVFVGPKAVLNGRDGKALGSYYGPPATWAAADGSKLTGKQLAVAPSAAGNIPMQLVQIEQPPATGAMSGYSYIQRVATRGGVAPTMTCDAGAVGRNEIVQYQADYIFWKPM